MARENQGLQIALIVFVMLTIILGVTTFIFYRQYEETDQKARTAQDDAAKQRTAAQNVQGENNELKKLMGFAATMDLAEINKEFGKDMETYASTFPEDARFYHPVLEYLSKAIHDRSAELVDLKTQYETLKVQYQQREMAKDPQIAEFQKAQQSLAADLAARTTAFDTSRGKFEQDQADTKTKLDKLQAQATAQTASFQTKLDQAGTEIRNLSGLVKDKSEKLSDLTKETFEVPDGEVTWVNLQGGSVYINLGRADALAQQITFAVYPADTTNLTRGGKKASIEVTQILGEHLAMARVLEDEVANPILAGDKIHTPIWAPGQSKHFALAGFMDIDGDGKSDQALVKNLITMSGGVVDCETDAAGAVKGAMSINTRYLVLGDTPNEKSREGRVQGYSTMKGEADRLGIQKIPLADLLQNMGWKKPTQVVKFGRGANPNDFKPEGEEVPRKSAGTVSGLFQPRRPPSGAAGGAY